MNSKSTFASVIANRGFRFLWINQILLQLAYNTLNFALIIWVFKLTDSNFAVAALMLSIYLPSLIFGLIAGVFVDLSDRRKVILAIDFLLAISFIFFIFIKDSYTLILLTTFFINCLSQFFVPTESSAIPLLVKKRELLVANSLFSLTLYGAFMIGFSLAGPIMAFWGIEAIFLAGFCLSFIAGLVALNLPTIRVGKKRLQDFLLSVNGRQLTSLVLDETKTTLNFIRGRLNIATSIILMAGIQGIIGVLAVVTPSYMERVLKIHATDASYVLMIPLGMGMLIGTYLVGRFAANIPKRYIVLPAITTAGLLFFLAGITPFLANLFQAIDLPDRISRLRFFQAVPGLSVLFGFGSFILGICTVCVIVPAQTIIQQSSNEKIRGKIFSVLVVFMNLFAAIPVILVGALSDLFGVIPIIIFVGLFIFSVGLLARRPALFFAESHLPYKWREFLGLGHWQNGR